MIKSTTIVGLSGSLRKASSNTKLLKYIEKKIKSILLITSDLHMQRAEFLFNQLSGLKVTPYSVSNSDIVIPFEKLVEEYIKLIVSKLVFIKKYEI